MQSILTINRSLAFTIVVLVAASVQVAGQSDIPPATNEYRVTNITTKLVNDKTVLFTYYGYTNSPDKEFKSVYGSPPNLIYQVKPWMELLLGMVVIYNDNKRTSDSWEFRPVGGVKFYIPNEKKLNLYSLSRFEYRAITQDNSWQKIPRFRNRFGVEAPLGRGEKAWALKTFYVLGDVEPVWRLDQNRLQFIRLRGGLGYIFDKKWRAEFIYHAELSGPNTDPFDHTGNIWRLNIKLNIPRRTKTYTRDADID